MIDNVFLKVTFVKSDANVADIFTKNLEAKKYELFQKMLQVHPKHFKKEGYWKYESHAKLLSKRAKNLKAKKKS